MRTLKTRFNITIEPLIQNLDNFWQQRSAREQKMLLISTLILIFGGGYAFIWQPTQEKIKKLEHRLPQEHAALAHLQTVAQQIRATRNNPLKVDHETLKPTLLATLAKENLNPSIFEVHRDTHNSHIELTLNTVSFAQWLRWLETQQRDYGLRLDVIQIDAQPNTPDKVSLKATLSISVASSSSF
jgi:type II secretory pathway component PulM